MDPPPATKPLSGDAPGATGTLQHRMLENPKETWERCWVWASERANPIVVKEVRQSLKSKQFTFAFGATLLAAIGWTVLAVSLGVPRIYYVPSGATLLVGYLCILILPLMVIIPFSAFRSLTAETEDSTFELLSISALSATQIVHGKMASALVQIVLYLSAIAPCIVLTYLLRGVSIFTILFVLGLTFTFSVSEAALALLFAAIGRTRMVQNAASVVMLTALLLAGFGWLSFVLSGVLDEISSLPREVYLVLFGVGTIVVTAVSLVLHAAAAAIDFPAENHSTKLRLRILALVTLVFFWTLFAAIATEEAEALMVMLIFLFIFMMSIGALMTGEYGVISPRAQRTLPKTFFGRIFLTWLYPGAGLGYIFVVSIFAAMASTLAIAEVYYSASLRNWFGNDSVMVAGYVLTCYLIIYLGLNRLVLLCLPSSLPAKMVGSFALMAVILLFAHLVPLLVVFYLNGYREFDYGWHQAFNIFWTTNEALRNSFRSTAFQGVPSQIRTTMIIVTLSAIGVFGLNLLMCTRDVLLVRVAEPKRVREDKGLEDDTDKSTEDPFAE